MLRRAKCASLAVLATTTIYTIEEPWTGIQFDPRADGREVKGVGCRCMMGLCWLELARVYAVAVEVQGGDVLRRRIAGMGEEWSGVAGVIRAKEEEPGIAEIAIRCTMGRRVEAKHVSDGLSRSLGKFLDGGSPELWQICSGIERRGFLEKGDSILWVWRRDGMVEVRVVGEDGETKEVVGTGGLQLGKAICNAWLDKDGVGVRWVGSWEDMMRGVGGKVEGSVERG